MVENFFKPYCKIRRERNKIKKIFLDKDFEILLDSKTNFEDNLSIIGSGKYSKIYGFNNKYAIKIIEDEDSNEDDCNAEISILNEISKNHDGIIKGFGVFKIDKSLCFVIERKVSSLDRYLFKDNSEKENVISQLKSGLSYLHDNFYLHLDISMSNILYDFDQNLNIKVYISDFSLSQKTFNLKYTDNHHKISIVYRPYENLLGSTIYSNKSDIWSLGILIYEIMNDLRFEDQITPIFIDSSYDIEKSVLLHIQKLISWNKFPSNNLLNLNPMLRFI